MSAVIIDINKARLNRDWKKSIKAGPIPLMSMKLVRQDQIDRSKGDIITWEKKSMAQDFGRFLLDEGFINFDLSDEVISDLKVKRLEARVTVFIGSDKAKELK